MCAHTGVASYNTKCQAWTLNSLFTGALRAAVKALVRVRLLVIDEISMASDCSVGSQTWCGCGACTVRRGRRSSRRAPCACATGP